MTKNRFDKTDISYDQSNISDWWQHLYYTYNFHCKYTLDYFSHLL